MTRTIPVTTFSERPLHALGWRALYDSVRLPGDASPIEIAAAKAFAELLVDPAEFGPPAYVNLFLPVRSISGHDELPPIRIARTAGAINVIPECPVGSYRVDFMLAVKGYGRGLTAVLGAMECDGHDYHERTKEQAAYDRRRDRYLQEQGIFVMRFPGFEIHDNPKKCAREAINVLLRTSAARGK